MRAQPGRLRDAALAPLSLRVRACSRFFALPRPQYEEGSAPALALNATIEKTHTRFKNYGEQGLLCGADGLPHLIVDGSLQHLGEFTYPGIGFLYVAGWIGYAGRSYVISNKETEKPLDGEIIIDVPKALGIMFSAAGWPLLAVRELQKGTLLEDDANITVSPR
jgi:photosystem I subunit 3